MKLRKRLFWFLGLGLVLGSMAGPHSASAHPSTHTIRVVLGRYALHTIRAGDATGYYLTNFGAKSAVVHLLGFDQQIDPLVGRSEWSERVFVRKVGPVPRYEALPIITTPPYFTSL